MRDTAGALSAVCLFLSVLSLKAVAAPLPIFNTSNGWTQFASDDGYRKIDGYVNPGYGGQLFDAEFLFYKLQDNIFSIGLQTGFDVIDGNVYTGNINYYSGDLALSFDESPSTYEYAVDFGLFTKGLSGNKAGNNRATSGIDSAGIYKVTKWNNDVYSGYSGSKPFAMDSGTAVSELSYNSSGSGYSDTSYSEGFYYGGYSYYRIVGFPTYPLFEIIPGNPIQLSAHWTMSCGNDAINSATAIPNPIPEPGTIALISSLVTGLLGFTGLLKRKT